MDYTREPIIETVITPKEGCKLVVRSSKSTGQEEFFVDALEVISFGNSLFFRSIERPKPFLVPASDYEVLEVREARMVLKNVGLDRSIKIGGGRESNSKTLKEAAEKVEEVPVIQEEVDTPAEASEPEVKESGKVDRKRDRRRHYRRRRGREEATKEEGTEVEESQDAEIKISLPEPKEVASSSETPLMTASLVSSLLPPPPNLISETIAKYKENALFKSAFYSKEETGTELAETSSEADEIEMAAAAFEDHDDLFFDETEDESNRVDELSSFEVRSEKDEDDSEEKQPFYDPFSLDFLSETVEEINENETDSSQVDEEEVLQEISEEQEELLDLSISDEDLDEELEANLNEEQEELLEKDSSGADCQTPFEEEKAFSESLEKQEKSEENQPNNLTGEHSSNNL